VSAGPSVPPGATSWSVDLAEYSSGVSGLAYQLDVSVEDTNGLPAQTSRTVDFEVYPDDVGALATCTKSYANGKLSLGFTISPPPPATPGQVFDARLWLFRRSDAEGWPLDPIDPIWTGFNLQNPITLTPEVDGEFQMVFTGLIGFAIPFQASLRIDTLGGPNDVCTLVP
jgi:hypothetical protein